LKRQRGWRKRNSEGKIRKILAQVLCGDTVERWLFLT